ncbi:unnamed protein product, partial [Discosporangium mesarthrocarpum]
AERCVDHAWRLQRRVLELRTYNSALHSRTAVLKGGGTDWGAPVRQEAAELDEMLKDSDVIRSSREKGRAPDSLLPMGRHDDYTAPVKDEGISLGKDDAFGVVQTGSIGAKFSIYEGRPDRYFDNREDPRRRSTGEVEDSEYTRQAQAPDLLDLDIGQAEKTALPDTQDLLV